MDFQLSALEALTDSKRFDHAQKIFFVQSQCFGRGGAVAVRLRQRLRH